MHWVLISLIATYLNGCGQKQAIFESGQTPLMQAYEDVAAKQARYYDRPLQHGTADLSGYVRTAQNELDTRFPLLPNPTITLFVFPHISGEAPVPGYITQFKLYNKQHYALPGEQ